MPARCVLFFVNEKAADRQLVAVPVDINIIEAAIQWTHTQVENLQQSKLVFEKGPATLAGGEFERRGRSLSERVTDELQQQCTACGQRYDCAEYGAYLKKPDHPDINRYLVTKN